MDARLNFLGNPVSAKFIKHVNAASAAVMNSGLPAATGGAGGDPGQPDQRLRLLHRHAHQGRLHAGESQQRLNLVAAWREATVFTDAERAALELTEQGTRIADAAGGVSDEVWANAAKHYDDDQLAALVSLIALINAYNRMNVIVQQPVGTTSPACSDNRPCDAGQGLGEPVLPAGGGRAREVTPQYGTIRPAGSAASRSSAAARIPRRGARR